VAGAAGLVMLFRRDEPIARGLVSDPNRILDLPPGFSYRVLDRGGSRMSDGFNVPSKPDGMACFLAPDGSHVLMRNHELTDPEDGPASGGKPMPTEAFDRQAGGGVTRLVLDPDDGSVRSSNLVLAGTLFNCAGGASPWGWLSCEESVEPGHGFVFVCPIDASEVRTPQPVPGYGRFRHEAVAIDPRDHAAYLTEDRDDGAFYRFMPVAPDRPFEGKLQAMAIRGEPARELSNGLSVGAELDVHWIDLDGVDAPEDDLRYRAVQQGAALVRRAEGAFWHEDRAYFTASAGGPRSAGQVFALDPTADGGKLTLIAQAEDDSLDHPDNICLSTFGDVYLAEDGGGDQYLRVIKPDGRILPFARNARSQSELAGVCFSPNNRRLFVNLQHDDLTLAIEGNFTEFGA
jgi:secreted PhoX family phosphatase